MRLAAPLLSAGMWLLVCACNAPAGPADDSKTGETKPPAADPPRIAPEARAALLRMSQTLQRAQGIRFFAKTQYDDVLPSGLRLLRTNTVRYLVSRPTGLRVEFEGHDDSRLLVYDGSTATLYDRDRKFYAVTSAPDTLDAALDMLAREADVVVPLSDLLYRDPGAVLLEKVTAASRVGTDTIDGMEAEHFVFSQAGLDWQIWIAKGERAVPLRLVLTYLTVDGHPQFTATLSDWNLLAETKVTDFKVVIPPEARQADFAVDQEGA